VGADSIDEKAMVPVARIVLKENMKTEPVARWRSDEQRVPILIVAYSPAATDPARLATFLLPTSG
jgi:hypothetical protein